MLATNLHMTKMWKDELYDYRKAVESDQDHAGLSFGQRYGERSPWSERSKRMLLDESVFFSVPGGFATGSLTALSGGGMIIRAKDVALGGTRAVIGIRHPEGIDYYPVKVRWSISKKAFGIMFDGQAERFTHGESFETNIAPIFKLQNLQGPIRRPLAA